MSILLRRIALLATAALVCAAALAAEALQAVVERLVVERAATIVALQRRADAREEALLAELAARDRRLRAQAGAQAAARTELERVTAQRRGLLEAIAARDRQLAAEVEEYRRQVASIAESPDPRKRAALQRYADGDRAGAYDALLDIQRAETRAVAAGWRELAALARDRRDRGELSTAEAIVPLEEALRIDPDHAGGWGVLERLYFDAGRVADAVRAGRQSVERSRSAFDRASALDALGEALLRSGDAGAALASYREALVLRERLVADAPQDATLQRAVAVSHTRLSDLERHLGRASAARVHAEAARTILQRLADSQPGSELAQSDLVVGLNKLGDAAMSALDYAAALEAYAAAARITGQLAERLPQRSSVHRQDGSTLMRLGDAQLRLDQLDAAAQSYAQAEQAVRRALAGDAQGAEAQRFLALALEKRGELAAARGDPAAAAAALEQSVAIARQQAAADPSDARGQADLAESLMRLGRVLETLDAARAERCIEESIALFEALDRTGRAGDLMAVQHAAAIQWLAELLVRQQRHDAARRRLEAGVAIGERLVAAQPRRAEYLAGLAWFRLRLAQLPGGEAGWPGVVEGFERLAALRPLSAAERAGLDEARGHTGAAPR